MNHMVEDKPCLKFEDDEGREIPLNTGSVWKIGRGEQNAVVLIDDMVSRHHAMIQQLKDGEFYLIDMNSANGSYVNGRKVTLPAALRHGDRLVFGKSRLAFRNPARNGAPDASSQQLPMSDPEARSSKQAASVLVVYIREFAAVTQSLTKAELTQLVSTWSAEVDRVVHDCGGTPQKHLGNSVITAWRHGAKGHEHIEILRILRAVAGVARMTATLHESFNLAEPLRIGAGVNTGQAGDSATFPLPPAVKDLEADLVLGNTTFDYLCMWPDWAEQFPSSHQNGNGEDTPHKTRQISFDLLSGFLVQHREDTGTTALPPLRSR